MSIYQMNSTEGLSEAQLQTFREEGLLVIEDFLSVDEVMALKSACHKLVEDMDPAEHRGVFSTTDHQQASDTYFLESGDKIRFFFEAEAFDSEGNLVAEKTSSLNKIGHALHVLQEDFRRVSFCPGVKSIAKALGLRDPAIVQGMYIFKQPGIGGVVTPHQDGTFFNHSAGSLYGFWFPLDEATLENGCLWYVPGSHKRPVTKRFIRTGNKDKLLEFVGENPELPDDNWVAAPVKPGSLVLIHGQVLHKSEKNSSEKPRHAYTFHIIEMKGSEYSQENWLQPPKDGSLPRLYA